MNKMLVLHAAAVCCVVATSSKQNLVSVEDEINVTTGHINRLLFKKK